MIELRESFRLVLSKVVRRLSLSDLSVDSLNLAYRHGFFLMADSDENVDYYCPNTRAIFLLQSMPQCPRSMKKFIRHSIDRYRVFINRDPVRVMQCCAAPRDGESDTWICPDFYDIYTRFPTFTSVEVYNNEDQLVGGLYGLLIGKIFAGESMFSFETNTSKLAFYLLVEHCRKYEVPIIDSQIPNNHTLSLGCVVISLDDYLQELFKYRDQKLDESFYAPQQIYP